MLSAALRSTQPGWRRYLQASFQREALDRLSLDGSGPGQAYARSADGMLNSPDNPSPRGSEVIGVNNLRGSQGVRYSFDEQVQSHRRRPSFTPK